MKIVVTGGSGFLGSHVADALSREGHKVIIFDKKKSKWIRPDQEMRIGDILNVKALENAVIGSDIVFHFAALADINQAIKNPLNTVNIKAGCLFTCRSFDPDPEITRNFSYTFLAKTIQSIYKFGNLAIIFIIANKVKTKPLKPCMESMEHAGPFLVWMILPGQASHLVTIR